MQLLNRLSLALCTLSISLLLPAMAFSAPGDGIWNLLDTNTLSARAHAGAEPWVNPQRYQAVELAPAILQSLLDDVPHESSRTGRAATENIVLQLPTPDGGFESFELFESPVVEPGLAHWLATQGWPMNTYKGRSLKNPATTARLDWGGPRGFHAMVSRAGDNWFIDPAWRDNNGIYLSYFRRDYTKSDQPFSCELTHSTEEASATVRAGSSTNGQLRTYRTVVAATGEYSTFHGGKPQAVAAIVTTINRVNEVYERDLALRLVLVANNPLVVYDNASTDPYSNDDGYAMLGQNQANINNVIGSSNYDLGHVFSTGGGGVAGLGVSCRLYKAEGVTGRPAPVGDPFDIDYVAHEMGHQLGGNHTFNSPIGSCGGGNRNGSTAYEPGSGSTIQAYAGICGIDNLQSNSDAYFHGVSLDEMLNHLGGAGNCWSEDAANPNAPTVSAGADYVIPINTSFKLTALNGHDGDGDSLTYTWEEFDLGPSITLATEDNGYSPIFRSMPPTGSPVRYFPLLSSQNSVGEQLPTTNRTMNFRVTVRDNNPAGGRVGEDSMTVTSSTGSGPFTLTAPNGGESFDTAVQAGTTVTWNVANTNAAPVNTSRVAISLSLDGGQTFPHILAANTANDGSEAVTLPGSVFSSNARIMVSAIDNIFFDVSDAGFSITDGNAPTDTFTQCSNPGLAIPQSGSVSDTLVVGSMDTLLDLDVSLDIAHSYIGDLTLSLQHAPSGTSVVLLDRPGLPAASFGCDQANILATLDDSATSPAEDECATSGPAINGRFKPSEPLASFNPPTAEGNWILTIIDSVTPDGGTLNQWCLNGTILAPPTTQTLTVINNGSGAGTVTSSPPGINCGIDCDEVYPYGSSVTLTATAAPGSTFSGWSGGDCSGTSNCMVTMNQAQNVTASFSEATFCSLTAHTINSSYSSGVHEVYSQDSIETSGTVVISGNGTMVNLRAPNSILLGNGFAVLPNAIFSATIGNVTCSGP